MNPALKPVPKKTFLVDHQIKRQFGSSLIIKSEDNSKENFAKRMLNKLLPSDSKYRLRTTGFFLLSNCTQKVDVKNFFDTFGMPDTFYSWFLVTELHVWMLAVRLMEEGKEGRSVRNYMVEALWQDCDARAKLVGDMAATTRSKEICDIGEEFQAALFIYDEGLVGDDKDLANALWRRFFLSQLEEDLLLLGDDVKDEDFLPDPEKIEKLVSYVRRTIKMLEDADTHLLFEKHCVDWLPLS